jgi:hypothetical protein
VNRADKTDAKVRRHRSVVIEAAKGKMAKESITSPVRLEFDRLSDCDISAGIVKHGPNIWLAAPMPGQKRTGNHKVERLKDQRWTCSCRAWQKHRFVDCGDIKRVKRKIGLGDEGPFDGRRRRLLTKVLYAGGHSDETRKDAARREEPKKVPLLAGQLCSRFVRQPLRSEGNAAAGGANGIPWPVRVYALLMKVFWNCSYEQLQERLKEDGRAWELGLLKFTCPVKRSFIRWFGDPILTAFLRTIFEETTKPTRRFESLVIGDSHDIPTRMVDNSRDRKFGPKPANYRNKERPLVRQQFMAGKVSNNIYALATTLTRGLGTGDAPHLPNMLEDTKRRLETVAQAALDKGYDGASNFEAAESLRIDLYVREKSGEDRQSEEWSEMARRLSKLERSHPEKYDEVSRFRPKAEATPSRIKARNPYIRLRRRNADPVPKLPKVPEKTKICDLSKEVRDAVFEAATQAVGVARLNESIAIIIVANLRSLNMLEHLYDQSVTFEEDVTLNPPLEMSERDLGVA